MKLQKKNKCCIQGLVSLTDNEQRTLMVYEGSHLLHEDYFYEGNRIYHNQINVKSDWQLIDEDYLTTIKDKSKSLKVSAGSLVLWDSRTLHQNQYGKAGSEERIVQYVCYLPKNHPKNTLGMRKKRRKYFEERRTTSHWPCPIKVNGKQGRNFGNERLRINYENLRKPDLADMMDEINRLL